MAYFQQMTNDYYDDDDDLEISDHQTLVYDSTPILTEAPLLEMPCNTEEEEVEEEEDGGYDYEFIKPGPPNIYFCPICQLVARNAHQTSCCGKIFCAVCIERLNQSGYQIQCTLCRQDFHYFKDIRTIREIKSLKIYCTNHSNGCDWNGDLEKIQEHIKTFL